MESEPIDPTQRLLIERDCERLVIDCCHFVDHGQASRIADLFSEDGVWTAPGLFTTSGREALRKGMAAREAKSFRTARHLCSNFRLEILDANHAEGVVYVTIYRHDGREGEETGKGPSPLEEPPLMVGEYRDRFVRTAEGWRIARREVGAAFVRSRSDGKQ